MKGALKWLLNTEEWGGLKVKAGPILEVLWDPQFGLSHKCVFLHLPFFIFILYFGLTQNDAELHPMKIFLFFLPYIFWKIFD